MLKELKQKKNAKEKVEPEMQQGPRTGRNRRLWLCITLGVLSALLLAGGIVLLTLEQQALADTGIRQGTSRLSVAYEYAYNPNDLYTQPKPGEKDVRIAAYVKNMRFLLNYSLTGLDDFATESEVSARAVLTAHANDTNKYIDPDFTVWQKEEELLAPEKIAAGNHIEKAISVDVNKYLKYCTDIFEETKASTSNELKLILRVDTTVQGPMGPTMDTATVEYIIPMLENLIVVQGTPELEKQIQISTRPPDNRLSLLPFALAAFALALGGCLWTLRVALPKKIDDGITQYRKSLDKVFHQYGERLVRMENPLPYQHLVTIPIAGIAEMVKIADEINQPVFYYRVDTDDEKKSEFYVFDAGRIYFTVIVGELGMVPEGANPEI